MAAHASVLAGAWRRRWSRLAAAAIFSFLFAWNEFLFALILTGCNTGGIPVADQLHMREMGILWRRMTAVVMMRPALLFTLFAMRYLERGLTFGQLSSYPHRSGAVEKS